MAGSRSLLVRHRPQWQFSNDPNFLDNDFADLDNLPLPLITNPNTFKVLGGDDWEEVDADKTIPIMYGVEGRRRYKAYLLQNRMLADRHRGQLVRERQMLSFPKPIASGDRMLAVLPDTQDGVRNRNAGIVPFNFMNMRRCPLYKPDCYAP